MIALMDITISNPGVYYAIAIAVGAIIMLVAGVLLTHWADQQEDVPDPDLPYLIEAFKGSVVVGSNGRWVFERDNERVTVVCGVPCYASPQPTEEEIILLVPGSALSRRWLSQETLSGMQIHFIRWAHLATNKCDYAIVKYQGVTFHIRIEDHVEALAFQKWMDVLEINRRIPMPWELTR